LALLYSLDNYKAKEFIVSIFLHRYFGEFNWQEHGAPALLYIQKRKNLSAQEYTGFHGQYPNCGRQTPRLPQRLS